MRILPIVVLAGTLVFPGCRSQTVEGMPLTLAVYDPGWFVVSGLFALLYFLVRNKPDKPN